MSVGGRERLRAPSHGAASLARLARARPETGDDIFLYIDPDTLIRLLRQRLGLSQRSLALRAGTTQAAVSRIERGLTTPTWETVRALLLAMGCEPELSAKRLQGRFDPLHLASMAEREPGERIRLAMSANRLAWRLRKAGAEARARG